MIISILSGIFINKQNLAFGFLEILEVSICKEAVANETEIEKEILNVHNFWKWKSQSCQVPLVKVNFVSMGFREFH